MSLADCFAPFLGPASRRFSCTVADLRLGTASPSMPWIVSGVARLEGEAVLSRLTIAATIAENEGENPPIVSRYRRRDRQPGDRQLEWREGAWFGEGGICGNIRGMSLKDGGDFA